MFTDQMKDWLFNQAKRRYSTLNNAKKLFLIAACIFLLLLGARVGFFGAVAKKLSMIVLPMHIEYLDTQQNRLKINSLIEHHQVGKTTVIHNGASVQSDAKLSLQFSINQDCWVLVVAQHANGIQTMWGNNLQAAKYRPYSDKSYDVIDFMLDDEIGKENYYVFAARQPFSFNVDIAPHLAQSKPNTSVKGNVLLNNITLPKDIVYRRMYLVHI